MKKLIPVILTLSLGFIANYFLLPAWNIQNMGTWFLLIGLAIIFTFLALMFKAIPDKLAISCLIGVGVIFCVMIAISFASSRMFQAKAYAKIIEPSIVHDEFENYTATLDNVPLLDGASATLMSNRKLGTLIVLVSQFEIGGGTQSTYKGRPVRVYPLNYGGFFKWLNNKDEGAPGYIIMDLGTKEAELIEVAGGIKFSNSEYFRRDLSRHLHSTYPNLIMGKAEFELDEEGKPYWIVPVYEHTIGLFGGKDVAAAITVNATTGETKKYNVSSIPQWIDNVYSSTLIMQQYDDYGSLQSGWLNSMFSQKNATVTTEGYNYVPMGDDNWIYTGVTSMGKDESNIGFILTNKRTRETKYYTVSGAEEYSGMTSAEGVVQHLGYKSTFPLLLNVEGHPTYLVALKDAGGLVKMYGMINVEKYQIVATGTTVQETQDNYRNLLRSNGESIEVKDSELINGTVSFIKEALKNGNSVYYISLLGNETIFALSILDNETVILLKVGDDVTLRSQIANGSKIVSAVLEE